jgi:nicotinamidase-related amidase
MGGNSVKIQKVKFEIQTERTALLIVDMQDGFLSPESPMGRAEGRELIPRLNLLIGACRERGVSVMFTRQAFKSDFSDLGLYSEFFPGPPEDYLFVEGRPEANIYREMARRDDDYVITKTTFSAFVGTGLEAQLKAAGIDTLIIGGVDVHICCEATARDARHLGLRVIFLSDGTAARDQIDIGWGTISSAEVQRHTLSRMASGYAEVSPVAEIITRLTD